MANEQRPDSVGRERKKKPVILIHGIGSKGEWQEETAEVVSAFFDPVIVKYWHYRGIGAISVILEVWTLLVGGIFLVLAYLSHVVNLFGLALLGAIILILPFLTTSIRRWFAEKSCVRQMGDRLHARPHFIAHSFGTYLTARILETYPAVLAGRIIFVGSVVNPSKDWVAISTKTGVRAIRNEWTIHDWVVRLAGIAGWIHNDLGQSGRKGFDSQTYVHNVANARKVCDQCSGAQRALLHNIDCSGLGHSDHFLAKAHAIQFWLPFFWSIDPGEYADLLNVCHEFDDADQQQDFTKLAHLERRLQEDYWQWADGTVWDRLSRAISRSSHTTGEHLAHIVALAVRAFCISISNATKDRVGGEHYLMLNPHSALAHAAKVATES